LNDNNYKGVGICFLFKCEYQHVSDPSPLFPTRP
jgi:hypothetical protein